MRFWLIAVLATACSYKPSAAGGDGAIDQGGDDDSGGNLCLGSGEFRICLPPPTGDFMISGTNTGLDTESDPACTTFNPANGRPSLCVVAASTITVTDITLFGHGARPLVLFASGEIHIDGGVDVGSHVNGQAEGAGHDTDACMSSTGGTSANGGGGGGAGGTFVTRGGNGGPGGGSVASDQAPQAIPAPEYLRGGCKGSRGGNGTAAGGSGNVGGGGVMLLSATSIVIDGYVNASGAGGNPAMLVGKGGGGGGGSGGMIVLSAPSLAVTGRLLANGGGGASGASGGGLAGKGGDPDITTPLTAAVGGVVASGPASAGGIGSVVNSSGGSAASSSEGAGGGGGGLGVIRVLSGQALGGMVSPTPI